MQAELEGNLLVGPCSFPDRYREVNCLEVQEVSRQLVVCQVSHCVGKIEVGLAGEGVLLYP